MTCKSKIASQVTMLMNLYGCSNVYDLETKVKEQTSAEIYQKTMKLIENYRKIEPRHSQNKPLIVDFETFEKLADEIRKNQDFELLSKNRNVYCFLSRNNIVNISHFIVGRKEMALTAEQIIDLGNLSDRQGDTLAHYMTKYLEKKWTVDELIKLNGFNRNIYGQSVLYLMNKQLGVTWSKEDIDLMEQNGLVIHSDEYRKKITTVQ